jgi:tetratricopeptide (TPR) repeat protein
MILLCVLYALAVPRASFAGRSPVAEQVDASSVRQEKIKKAREFYAQGQKFLREGNYSAANEAFGKAELVLGREDPEQLVDVPPAPADAPAAERIIPLPVQDPSFYYNAGVEALKKGAYKQAQEAFAKALSFDPQDKDACYNLAVLYENYLGNKREALKYYLRYVNLAPEAPDAEQVRSWIDQLNTEVSAE